jgi:hypothetical protein
MSHSLDLVAGLLAAARNLQAVGRDALALDLLQRLAQFRELARETAEEIHSRLADLYAGRDELKNARRHLAIALTFRPQHAAYHHRMAECIEADPDAAVDRAGQYYRRAVRSEPDNATYWSDYGAYLLNAGRLKAGRRAVRRGVRLGGYTADLVGRASAVLRDAGLWDDARRLLRLARFRCPRDRRLQALWQQHQFEELCAQQQARAGAPAPRGNRRPIMLPFLRAAGVRPTLHVDGKAIRFDVGDAGNVILPLPQRRPGHPGNRRTR